MTSCGVNRERSTRTLAAREIYSDAMDHPGGGQLDVRLAALRAGSWLGWLSVVAVTTGVALGVPARHDAALLVLIAAAALANGIVVCVPRGWWTTARRGERMLDLWSLGLVALASALVLIGGGRADLDLLLFLIVPFLATVHTGARRAAWLIVAFGSLSAVMAVAPDPLSAGQLTLRLCLLVAATILALVFADLTRREATERAELSARRELERLLLAESHHRVKNSLQTVSDLLLLGRPAGSQGRAFDETAERIRAIAIVHRLLAEERGSHVDAGELLKLIANGLAPEARIRASKMRLDPTCAQHLGVVANELIANAVQHGRPPIEVELTQETRMELLVRDRGCHTRPGPRGLGLQLVEQVVHQGLHGTFAIEYDTAGATQARVTFDGDRPCAS